ncbi:MAG: tRNA guanosine(34) transglycosylase Tgt [Candidatus Diapherotrites archaeon]
MLKIIFEDPKTKARYSELKTAHGKIELPSFMPVETKGTAKYVSQKELLEFGANAIICNSFLLYLKPGLSTIKKFGGLHEFIKWPKSIFTDSGGFQIIEKEFQPKPKEKGVEFKSPFDGSRRFITPEKAIQIQEELNSDAAMCLDDVPLHDAPLARLKESAERTTEWAKRCKAEHKNKKQLLLGISQGGRNKKLRQKSLQEIIELDFDGIALGGLCIGEPKNEMLETIKFSIPLIPKEKPVYLMGVGSPKELIECISLGIDLFDSCFPTRMARHGTIFTSKGKIDIKKKEHSLQKKPLDEECECFVCREYSTSFIHHLFRVGEQNAMRYASHHNLFFVQNLMKNARTAIMEGEFKKFASETLKKFRET